MAWVGALSIQVPAVIIPGIRFAISDVFLVPMTALVLLGAAPRARRRSKSPALRTGNLSVAIVVFAFLFLTLGNAMEYQNVGKLTSWTVVNKDIGLICLTVSYFVGLRLLDSRRRLYRIVEAFLVSGLVLNSFAVFGGALYYAFGIGNEMIRVGSSLRLCGFMMNPSSYGGWLLCVVSLQAAVLIGQSADIVRMSRKLQWMNLVLAVVAMVMTVSRSAYLGCLAAVFAVMFFGRARHALMLLTAGACAVGFVIVLMLNSTASGIINDFRLHVYNDTTIDERMTANEVGLGMVADSVANIYIGIGVGTFLERSGERDDTKGIMIHNTFLWILVELGVVGLLALLAILGAAFRNCWRVARRRGSERPIAVGVCCALIGSMFWFLGTEGLWHRHVWFLLLLSEAAVRTCANLDGSRTPLRGGDWRGKRQVVAQFDCAAPS